MKSWIGAVVFAGICSLCACNDDDKYVYPDVQTEFVCLQTTEGFAVRHLKAGDDPKVVFRFTGKPIAVYAYCNVHGLWRLNIKDLCDNKTECSRIAMWF